MRSAIGLAGVVLALSAGVLSAQSIPFTLLATANGNASTVLNDSTLGFTTTVGTSTSITVKATYIGNLQATITATPQVGLVGSTQFSVSSDVMANTVLNRGDSFTFTVTYSPTNARGAAGQIEVPFTEPSTTGGMPVQNAILLGLQGMTPQFSLFYVLQNQNNAIPLQNNGTIPFGAVQLNTTKSANLNIANTGSGDGVITAITTPPANSPFQVQGIPLFPYTLVAGSSGTASNLQLLVTYTPGMVENDTAQVQISFQGGATETINLSGNGILSTFTYSYVMQGVTQMVEPNGMITLPGANVGQTSSIIVQVKNTGGTSATINSVSTSGPFTVTNPLTLPATVTPGNSFSVPITYTATKVGTETGQLVIGNDSFILSASGLGSALTFAYTSSAGTITVDPAKGGAVVFPPTPVGQSSEVQFSLTDTGLLPATISNIGISPGNGPYTISGLPALPLSLASGQSANFKIVFKPTATDYTNGASLILDTTSIPLIGSGSAPPALPSYTIDGPSGNVSPATQQNVSLTLANPYPLDLTGTLTLATQGTFGTDPAVQFAVGNTTGNRTVNFVIPANSTSANFAGQGTDLPLQTGTVAEVVTLTPTFATTGGVDITPSSPANLQFTVPSQAPVLVVAQAASNGTSSFNLILVGYSTTRSLTSMSVTFNPAPGYNVGTTTLSIDLTKVGTTWFQSTAAQAFGGQFMITMPFTLTGPTPKTGQTLLNSIASVTATVSNSTGTSNSLQTPVQ